MDLKKIRDKSSDSAQYMVDDITHVIKSFGKRGPGSEGEKNAVEYMAEKCKEYGCDDVKVESFKFHPTAFMGWIYITATFIIIAAILCIVAAVVLPGTTVGMILLAIAVVLILIGAVVMILEFVMYKQFVDKLYPEETSYNMTATKKPTGEIKRRIFLNGHPDSACEWTLNYIGGGVLFLAHIFYCMIGLIYLLITVICAFVGIPEAVNMSYAILAFVPAWLLLYILWNEKQVVDGANDNLTACFMGIAFMKALQEEGIEFENTEVGVLITGSEEAGLRGAKAWSALHKNEYDDVETIILAFDTIRKTKYLQVNKKDLNGFVAADPHACDLFKNAADKLGLNCNVGTVPLGATDSAAFAQAGLKSVGITALNHKLEDYYHTRKDTYDNLDADALADCFSIATQAVEDFDDGK